MTDQQPTMTITINGASDDILEVAVDGKAVEEFDALSEVAIQLRAPDGDTLDVIGHYGRAHSTLEWTLSIRATHRYPSWPIHFHERENYDGDPAITVVAPAGTTFTATRI